MSRKNLHDLSREEWLRAAARPGDNNSTAYSDEFSRRAVKGLEYAQGSKSLEAALERLDRHTEQRANAGAPTRRRPAPRWLAIAASLLVIVCAALFVWNDTEAPSTLFEEYFEPIPSAIPLTGNLRTQEETGQNLKRKALREYENEAYEPAIDNFQQYLTLQPKDNAVRLYLGIALLAKGQSRRAVDQLATVCQSPPAESYRFPALWYLALAYLQLDESRQSMEYLEELSNQSQSTFYRNKAENLLQAMLARGDGATI